MSRGVKFSYGFMIVGSAFVTLMGICQLITDPLHWQVWLETFGGALLMWSVIVNPNWKWSFWYLMNHQSDNKYKP